MILLLLFACDNDRDGFTTKEGDCNNDQSDQHPLAKEVCDGIDDNDCDNNTVELGQ